jgi:hypothetical protein
MKVTKPRIRCEHVVTLPGGEKRQCKKHANYGRYCSRHARPFAGPTLTKEDVRK